MLQQLLLVSVLTMLIHTSETLSYAIRFAGVRTGKLAVSMTLSGMIVLVSRTSNMVQGVMVGKMIDYAKIHAEFPLERYFRVIIGSASIGTVLAMLLFPSVVFLAGRMISHLEVTGSVPKLLFSVSFSKLKHAKSHLRKPTFRMLKSLRIYDVPKRLLILNCVVTSIYTVGVLAALYASFTAVSGTAASQSSGLINGIATIIMTVLIDPQIALLTDRALRNDQDQRLLGKVYGLMMMSRCAGTLLGQLIFLPAAAWVEWLTHVL
ncbi:hypothetical protein BVG16_02875 [Paenibacillus selenitireducens]|uniref:Lipid II flippase Amj n=1 Tax=Paenibacillus selenitireducens TaxID=1324314 RepID=A0A1T2XNG1_9BACL|nr:lipid II flippase Amj family protein [Paenibacillus selenitireducens]OPA81276.1 hypothetical protein BVG16_02875 [Paenibacillus selenitireducens]